MGEQLSWTVKQNKRRLFDGTTGRRKKGRNKQTNKQRKNERVIGVLQSNNIICYCADDLNYKYME
jgi:hypothetical protein